MLEVRAGRKQGVFTVQAAFTVEEKGITALFGPSGAGKTTVVNMIAGLARPDTGRILLNGHCLFDADQGVNLAPEMRRVGYIFQDGRLFPHLSVRANLTYGMRLVPKAKRYVTFDQVVELLGIGSLLKRRPAKLSGGEKQRVALGRALLSSPELFLMDEPLASLDGPRKAEVLPFITRLCREFSTPILFVSHSPDEIFHLADRLVLLDEGRVVASGLLGELTARRELIPYMDGDYGAMIDSAVETTDDGTGLTYLGFAGGLLKVPKTGLPRRAPVRVHIPARHVAVARVRPAQSTLQNVFPARIDSISEKSEDCLDVALDIGCLLWARITPGDRERLGLEVGQKAFALINDFSVLSR
jgi:molybdate transport system ATP-binding protein